MATSAFKSTTKRTPISSLPNAAAESGFSTKPHRRSRSLSLFSQLLPDPPKFAFIQAKCLETGETMAMKKVLQDRRYKNHKLQLMRLMDHPNVVSLKHCFFSTRSKDELFLNLVMEYVPETMYSVLKHYSNANQRIPLICVKLYTYQSFENAWKATCSAREVSGFSPTMHIPDGYEFLLQPVIFSGPCNSEAVNVVIDGNLTAPSHPSKWKCDGSNCRQWIGFIEINGLYIYGSGTINAQGTKWWGSDVNHNRKYHGSKPTGFVIAHSNNVHISDLTFIDSPQMHMALERSTWVYVYNLTITAPRDSPNTDGIHIQHSTRLHKPNSHWD